MNGYDLMELRVREFQASVAREVALEELARSARAGPSRGSWQQQLAAHAQRARWMLSSHLRRDDWYLFKPMGLEGMAMKTVTGEGPADYHAAKSAGRGPTWRPRFIS